jgi:hypothetical protein
MIKQSNDPPAGVIGFEVAGKIEAEDYRDVVLPAGQSWVTVTLLASFFVLAAGIGTRTSRMPSL